MIADDYELIRRGLSDLGLSSDPFAKANYAPAKVAKPPKPSTGGCAWCRNNGAECDGSCSWGDGDG